MDSNEYAGCQYWESTGTMLTGRLAGQKSAVYARRFRRVLEFICVIAMLVGSSYLINGLMIQEEYHMAGLRTEIMSLERENDTDRMEVARLEAPARIEEIAEQDLGMVVPGKAVFGSADQTAHAQAVRD